tara:strand:+ start:739 stop:951 length:213 start_codon:yes stop_codon:yes gene_type:complete
VVNRTSLGQLISTTVFYGVAFLIFLKGMDFLANGEMVHAYISFICALLNFLAGMRFAIASLYNRIKKLIK